MSDFDQMADSTFYCEISAVKDMLDRFVVTVAAEDEHGQVIGPDGIAIDVLIELIRKDDIGRDKFLLMENYKKIEELWPVHKL